VKYLFFSKEEAYPIYLRVANSDLRILATPEKLALLKEYEELQSQESKVAEKLMEGAEELVEEYVPPPRKLSWRKVED
jgi:hypothetical protein